MMPLVKREEVLPTPLVYAAHTWLDRLVCPDAQQPRWSRTKLSGPVAHYDVKCSNTDVVNVELDLAQPPPPPPAGLRLLTTAGFERYEAAIKKSGQKDSAAALVHIDAALANEPEEPLYRVARLSVLYIQENYFDVLKEADALLKTHPFPVAWKFKALAARGLGLRGELYDSLDGLIASTTPSDPLFAEAVCARGLLRTDEGERLDQATSDLEAGCRMGQEACCKRLEKEKAAGKDALSAPERPRLQRASPKAEKNEPTP